MKIFVLITSVYDSIAHETVTDCDIFKSYAEAEMYFDILTQDFPSMTGEIYEREVTI